MIRTEPLRLSEPDDDIEFPQRQPDWESVPMHGLSELRTENKGWIDSFMGQIGSLLGAGPHERDRGDKS